VNKPAKEVLIPPYFPPISFLPPPLRSNPLPALFFVLQGQDTGIKTVFYSKVALFAKGGQERIRALSTLRMSKIVL
jgi:hypothetical protein